MACFTERTTPCLAGAIAQALENWFAGLRRGLQPAPGAERAEYEQGMRRAEKFYQELIA